MRKPNDITIIAVGGSLMVPHLTDTDGIDIQFLKKFRRTIFQEVEKGRKFVIIVGGGKTCRMYQNTMRKFAWVRNADLDFIGIQSTRLNASVVWVALREHAYPEIINDTFPANQFAKLRKSSARIFIACGGEPGRSTDFGAMKLAEKFGAKEMVDAGDIDFVYDKDPKKFADAKPIRELSWREYRKLIPSKWTPGLASPIDPIAARLAEKTGIQAKIMEGTDLQNLKNAIEGKKFIGTIIA